MITSTIRLYADVVSPFAYLAFHRLRNDDAFKGVKIEYTPIFLAGLMHACGNITPIAIKNKDRWVDQERLRLARVFNLPMKPSIPPNFPPNTLHVMRTLCAISLQRKGQEKLARALDALYAALWTARAEIGNPQVFEPIPTQVSGTLTYGVLDLPITELEAVQWDTDLRFKGVQNLRIADASVVPIAIGAHIQAAVYALAEQAAAIIAKDRPPHAPYTEQTHPPFSAGR
ncbi:Thioredoxin-like protein [Apiospora saccharicola]